MNKESVNIHVNNYCRLRDKQYAVYTEYARKHGLTTKELFILDIIYFAQSGCTQAGICERLSATKQTVSAAIKNSGSWGTFLLKNPKPTGESGWYASPQPERNTWNASSPLPRRRKTTPWRN